MKRTAKTGFALLVLAVPVFFSGCGKGRTVTLAGSSTMVPLARHWAEVYMKANPGVVVRVEESETASGLAGLARGAVDACLASRSSLKEETEKVRARRNAEVKQAAVALDGVAIYVNEKNPIDEVSVSQLAAIYTGKAANWSQVGGQRNPIVAFGRSAGSGTSAWFKERVMDNQEYSPTVQALGDTEAVVAAVAKDPRAVGFGGMAFARGVRTIRVARKPGERGIEPSPATVAAGRYPLSRELFICTAGEPAGETASFLGWVVSPEGQKACQDAGYTPVKKAK